MKKFQCVICGRSYTYKCNADNCECQYDATMWAEDHPEESTDVPLEVEYLAPLLTRVIKSRSKAKSDALKAEADRVETESKRRLGYGTDVEDMAW